MHIWLVNFPLDAERDRLKDEYIMVPGLLVAPDVKSGARSRNGSRPADRSWKAAREDKIYPGGQWMPLVANLEHIPLSILKKAAPLFREMQMESPKITYK
jgi:alpha-D-xyloside xylohydrolase